MIVSNINDTTIISSSTGSIIADAIAAVLPTALAVVDLVTVVVTVIEAMQLSTTLDAVHPTVVAVNKVGTLILLW